MNGAVLPSGFTPCRSANTATRFTAIPCFTSSMEGASIIWKPLLRSGSMMS